MEIGHRLNDRLAELGIKQKDLAGRLGIAPSTLNGYLKDTREPDAAMFVKLSKELDISVDYIMGKTDTKKAPTAEISDKGDTNPTRTRLIEMIYQADDAELIALEKIVDSVLGLRE